MAVGGLAAKEAAVAAFIRGRQQIAAPTKTGGNGSTVAKVISKAGGRTALPASKRW